MTGLRSNPYHAAMRFRRSESEAGDTQIPELLITALNSLEAEALILMPGEVILYSSDGINNFGLLKDNRVTSEELIALIRVVRRTGTTHRGSIEIARGPIGEGKRELRVSVPPLNYEGMILVLISDESEARRIDAVRRDFVANISHELKTPIGALGLLSETIQSVKDNPAEVARFATRMHQEAERLSDLVQDVIDLSRLQSNDPLQQAFPVEIDDVIREAINQAHVAADARGVYIEVGSTVPATVIGDRDQLIMACLNLIENAVKYSPENTRVAVTSAISDGIVEIAVTDQGIGIPESDLNRIFERFYRVDPARSRETGGTGLGLSIVKHVAQNHGGDVKVWSKVGVGSTFTIMLPKSDERISE